MQGNGMLHKVTHNELGLAFGREIPQELSRLNVSPPDAKPVLAAGIF